MKLAFKNYGIEIRDGRVKIGNLSPIVKDSWASLAAFFDAAASSASDDKTTTSSQLSEYRSWVYDCVNIISNRLSTIDYYFVRADTNEEIKRDSKLFEVISRPIQKPNSHMSYRFLIQWMQTQLDLSGMCFALILPNKLGVPLEIWPLNVNDFDKILLDKETGFPVAFQFRYNSRIVTYPAENVLYVWYPSPTNLWEGRSPIQSHARIIDLDNYIEIYEKNFFKNSARFDIALQTEARLDEEEAYKIKQMWESKFQGVENAHRVAVLHSGLQAVPLQITNKDFEFMNLAGWTQDKILAAYGVPAGKLGLVKDVNRCLDESSEILTKRGWLKHNEITKNDLVATYNVNKNKVEFHKPINIYKYQYEGVMHYWKNERIDFMCTPNHKMLIRRNNSKVEGNRGSYVLLKSNEVSNRAVSYFVCGSDGFDNTNSQNVVHIDKLEYGFTGNKGGEPSINGYEIDAEKLAIFLGYFISEGSLSNAPNNYRISYAQSTETEEIDGVAKKMLLAMKDLNMGKVNIHTSKSKSHGRETGRFVHTFYFSNKSFHTWLKANVGQGTYKGERGSYKRIPECVFNFSRENQIKFLLSYVEGDGHVCNYKTGTFLIATASEKIRDDMQRLGVLLGYRTTISNHFVIFSNKKDTYVRRGSCKKVNYKGIVWSVEVPNHVFVSRRNGKVSYHGNSNATAIDITFNRECIQPRLLLWQDQWNRKVFSKFDSRIELRYQSPVPIDKEAIDDEMLKKTKGPIPLWTINEARKVDKKPPIPGGDVIYIPANYLPIGTSPPSPPASSPKTSPSISLSDSSKGSVESTIEDSPKKEIQMINWTDKMLEARWKAFDRRVTLYEASWYPMLTSFFTRQMNEVLAKVKKASLKGKSLTAQQIKIAVGEYLFDYEKELSSLEEAAKPIYENIVEEEGARALIEVGVLTDFDVFNSRIIEYIGSKVERFSRDVLSTKSDQLRKTLIEGIVNGEDVHQLSNRVRDVYRSVINRGWEAERIARTESTAASNFGAVEGYKQSGVVHRKGWLAVPDGRCRETHAAAGMKYRGQGTIPLDQDFVVGLGSGPCPGELGVAEEDCNCRCSTFPEVLQTLPTEQGTKE